MKKRIECGVCDSFYSLVFYGEEVDGEPDFCPFCGETIEVYLNLTDIREEEPLDFEDDDDK